MLTFEQALEMVLGPAVKGSFARQPDSGERTAESGHGGESKGKRKKAKIQRKNQKGWFPGQEVVDCAKKLVRMAKRWRFLGFLYQHSGGRKRLLND